MNESERNILDAVQSGGAYLIGALTEDGITHAAMGGSAGDMAVIAVGLLCGIASQLDDASRNKLKEIVQKSFIDETDVIYDIEEVEFDECNS